MSEQTMRELAHLLITRRYWEGISECECTSTVPSGGCLKCDMKDSAEFIAEIMDKKTGV